VERREVQLLLAISQPVALTLASSEMTAATWLPFAK
jgi:hypothetical protein